MKVSDAHFLVIDTETTGLDPATDKMVEFAGVLWTLRGGYAGNYQTLLNPGIPIPPETSAIHHLVDDDVADAPTWDEVKNEAILEPAIRVAHNAPFDAAFVGEDPKTWLCTRRLAMKLYPEAPSHKNQVLRYWLGLKVEGADGLAAHRALADALVTSRLLEKLLEKLDPDQEVEDLIAWTLEPILLHKCTFGKYAGTLWKDMPRDYLYWMIRQKDWDPDVLHTVYYYLGGGGL